MADNTAILTIGATGVVEQQAEEESGALLIVTGGTWFMYDNTGAAVSATATAISGWDTDASASVRVWASINASSLLAGTYTIVWAITAIGDDDGLARVIQMRTILDVLPAAPETSTYDPTETIGKLRDILQDVDPLTAIWSDVQLQSFIDRAGTNTTSDEMSIIYMAASYACRAEALQAARGSSKLKLGLLSNDPTDVPKMLMAMADQYAAMAGTNPSVDPPDRHVYRQGDESCIHSL